MSSYHFTALFRKAGIYQILNLVNGKVYIGSASNLGARKNGHFRALCLGKHPNVYFQRAYDKYGKDAFDFSVLEECPKEKLQEREQVWIDKYQAANDKFGYNIQPRADRRVCAESTKEKLRVAVTGFRHTEETKRKISESSKGRIKSEETRRKLSIANKGQVPWTKGRPQSEHQKQRVSDALKGNTHFKGKKHSPETIEKMKEAQRLRWAKQKANYENVEE